MGIKLNAKGERLARRGGADGVSDDEMLLYEIQQRAPLLSIEDLMRIFMSLRLQFGEDALAVVRERHVTFELKTRH